MRQTKTSLFGGQNSALARIRNGLGIVGAATLLVGVLAPASTLADVPHGSEASARRYYRALSSAIRFATPDGIVATTLDDVASYLGYAGITGVDLQNIDPVVLMNPEKLLASCNGDRATCPNALRGREAVLASLGVAPIRPEDILATRFFAPKIMNIREPEATRQVGWRKLVRLKARPGSPAQVNHVSAGIVLFNFFSSPTEKPFGSAAESVNTQVMLLTDPAHVPKPRADGPPTLYWLDYDQLSKGGKLSFALNATFDANELPQGSNGVQPYFVPDGCVACHGNNSRRSLVNYLDTDHWFDRLENDFAGLKARNVPLLFDAGTNDTSSSSYAVAFDVIRRFNAEADSQVQVSQPKHDETLASQAWLRLHEASNSHVSPIDRAIGSPPRWSRENPDDAKAIDLLNQYCFRCHGTVKFSVFNRQAVHERRAPIQQRTKATAPTGMRMPPDRDLPDDVRALLNRLLP